MDGHYWLILIKGRQRHISIETHFALIADLPSPFEHVVNCDRNRTDQRGWGDPRTIIMETSSGKQLKDILLPKNETLSSLLIKMYRSPTPLSQPPRSMRVACQQILLFVSAPPLTPAYTLSGSPHLNVISIRARLSVRWKSSRNFIVQINYLPPTFQQ